MAPLPLIMSPLVGARFGKILRSNEYAFTCNFSSYSHAIFRYSTEAETIKREFWSISIVVQINLLEKRNGFDDSSIDARCSSKFVYTACMAYCEIRDARGRGSVALASWPQPLTYTTTLPWRGDFLMYAFLCDVTGYLLRELGNRDGDRRFMAFFGRE